MKDVLTFGGKSLDEFNTFFDGSKSFGTPEKEYDLISIPGRSGDLSIFKDRYKDIVISFPCFIREDFVKNFRNLTQYLNSLNGYQRLETSKEPNYFRKALFLGAVEPTTGPFNKSGKFELKFRCNPQRWLKSGEHWYAFSGYGNKFFNPTTQPAKPLIRVSGVGTVTVGKRSFTIQNAPGYDYIDVDCDICDAYSGNVNLNNKFHGRFPVLDPGENQVIAIGNTVEIMPRWYEI